MNRLKIFGIVVAFLCIATVKTTSTFYEDFRKNSGHLADATIMVANVLSQLGLSQVIESKPLVFALSLVPAAVVASDINNQELLNKPLIAAAIGVYTISQSWDPINRAIRDLQAPANIKISQGTIVGDGSSIGHGLGGGSVIALTTLAAGIGFYAGTRYAKPS